MIFFFPTRPLDGGGSGGLTDVTAGNYVTVTTPGVGIRQVAVDLAALKADLLTRPTRQLWIGDALSGTVTPDGSAIAPYSMAQAITWINTQVPGAFDFKASAQAYGAFTWPAGYSGAFDCLAGGASVSDLTLDPFSGPAQRLTFRGFDVGDVDTSAAGAPTDTVLLRIERQGTIGTLSNTGGADVYLELVGAEEPTAVPASVSALGPLDKGAGTLTIQADSADIQQAVDCTSYTSTDCRNPENITAADITVTEAEDDQGVRSGSVWTATSCRIDQITAQRFATAGGSLVGGTFTIVDDGPWIASQGKTALAPGTPVYMLDDGGTLKVRAVDGTFAALRQDFVGFTGLTTAADGDAQLVVGNGGRAISIPGAITGGVYGALVPGKAYYVSGAVGVSTTVWLIFSEDDFSGIGGFNADAPAGSGYRLVGIADTTTTIMQAWEDAATT